MKYNVCTEEIQLNGETQDAGGDSRVKNKQFQEQ